MEEKEHGKLRSILFWGIPIVLTIILAFFVMNFLGYNVWSWGKNLPLISQIIPKSDAEKTNTADYQDDWKDKFLNGKVLLKEKEQKIEDLTQQLTTNQKTVTELKQNVEELKVQLAEERNQKIQDGKSRLSEIYSAIPPSKAAAMIESMSLEDASNTMSMLSPEVQSSILGGMKDSKKAGQITLLLNQSLNR